MLQSVGSLYMQSQELGCHILSEKVEVTCFLWTVVDLENQLFCTAPPLNDVLELCPLVHECLKELLTFLSSLKSGL